MRSCLILAVLVLSACPRSGPRAPAAPTVEHDLAALVIPVPESEPERARAALARLGQRAQAGDIEAAWTRIHYLIDLFDDARFARDDHSLALLHQALGHADAGARGPEATQAVLAGLLREVDRVLALDRLHARAQAARTVLEFDSRPPLTRVGLFSRMAALKAVARSESPLGDNARLRLAGYCRQALLDAPRARYAERTRVIAHCLYPLYDTDPEPYFADNPALRPPAPRWRDLLARLGELTAEVAQSRGRLGRAGAHMTAGLAAIADAGAGLPELPDRAALDALALPQARYAIPYDWTPLLLLGQGNDLSALDDQQAITQSVLGDGRRTLAVALSRDAPAELVTRVARVADSAGAARLELALTIAQTLKVPPGDYWEARVHDGTITRLAVIDLSLAPLDKPATARTPEWDPDRADLGLHLEIGGESWRLTSPAGVVATIAAPSAERAAAELGRVLGRVQAAFPDEDALVLVPGKGATVLALVSAAEASRHDEHGRERMTQLGLAARAPVARSVATKTTLAQRIERRAGAQVDIEPSALAMRASVVRGCYQDILDRRPAAAGRFRLELQGKDVVVTQGARDPDLRRCVVEGVGPTMESQGMASAVIELRAR
jgi:hypothetical protein